MQPMLFRSFSSALGAFFLQPLRQALVSVPLVFLWVCSLSPWWILIFGWRGTARVGGCFLVYKSQFL